MQKNVSSLKRKLKKLFPSLNEKQKRIFVALEAKELGYGGVSLMSSLTGMSRQTIYHGINDLNSPMKPYRVRKSGGGRKKLSSEDPSLLMALDDIVDSSVRGDPESVLRGV